MSDDKIFAVVETVRSPARAFWYGALKVLDIFNGHNTEHPGNSAGFLVFETRDGTPDMTTLRWEDAE